LRTVLRLDSRRVGGLVVGASHRIRQPQGSSYVKVNHAYAYACHVTSGSAERKEHNRDPAHPMDHMRTSPVRPNLYTWQPLPGPASIVSGRRLRPSAHQHKAQGQPLRSCRLLGASSADRPLPAFLRSCVSVFLRSCAPALLRSCVAAGCDGHLRRWRLHLT